MIDPERLIAKRVTFLLIALTGLYLATDFVGEEQLTRVVNFLGPVALGGICIGCGLALVRARRVNLWMPIAWFCVASVLFFGLGPLVYRWGPDALGISDPHSGVIEWVMWRTNLLNVVGTASVFAGYQIRFGSRVTTGENNGATCIRDRGATFALIVFFGIGLPVKYFLALPYEFGQTDTTLPGMVFSVAQFTSLGLLILAYKAVRNGGVWVFLFVCALIPETLVSIIEFSKASVVLTLISPALGIYLARPKLKLLLIGAPILFVAYVLVAPIVSEGRFRIATQNREGLIYQATLEERINIGLDIITYGTAMPSSEERAWWARLCYASTQIFAMQLYDSGMRGDSFLIAAYTFVPRVLWHDKPIITDVGVDFTELMFGTRTSSTGIGIYGEAYWNGGWMLVIVSAMSIGILFRVMERTTLFVFSRSAWLLLPCVFLAIKMGLRIDGWFAADYVGTAVMYAAYLILIRIVRLYIQTSD